MLREFTVSVDFKDINPGPEELARVDAEAENIRTVLEAQLSSWQRMYLHFSPESPRFEIGVR